MTRCLHQTISFLVLLLTASLLFFFLPYPPVEVGELSSRKCPTPDIRGFQPSLRVFWKGAGLLSEFARCLSDDRLRSIAGCSRLPSGKGSARHKQKDAGRGWCETRRQRASRERRGEISPDVELASVCSEWSRRRRHLMHFPCFSSAGSEYETAPLRSRECGSVDRSLRCHL